MFIPPQNVMYFLMLPFLVHKIFTFYINGVLNCKCPAPGPVHTATCSELTKFNTFPLACEYNILSTVLWAQTVVNIATNHRLDGPGFESQQRYEVSFHPKPSTLVLGPTQPLIQWVTWFFPGVKLPSHAVDHSPPPTANAEDEYNYNSAVCPRLHVCTGIALPYILLHCISL